MWLKSFFWANSLADIAKELKPLHNSLRRCFHRMGRRNTRPKSYLQAFQPPEKKFNMSIFLLLVRLIHRVEVQAVGRPISFRMRAAVSLLRDQGAWRLLLDHTSMLLHTDGRGMVTPENDGPQTGRIPMKLEPWPGGRYKKGDDDDGTN
jgi:hypothetical protein